MKQLVTIVLFVITTINGQFLSSLLSLSSGLRALNSLSSIPSIASAGPSAAYAGLSGNGSPFRSVAIAPGGIVADTGNIFGGNYPGGGYSSKAIDDYVQRALNQALNYQAPITAPIANFNTESSQYYNPNFLNPNIPAPNLVPGSVRPLFKYPSVKNSLNTAESSLKGINSPNGGGLSNPYRGAYRGQQQVAQKYYRFK